MKCRITSGSHSRPEGTRHVRYRAGDVIEMNDVEMITHKTRIEVIDEDTDTESDGVDMTDVILGKGYREIVSIVGGLRNADNVRELWTKEQEGKDRKSVIDALRTRLEEIGE